MRAGRALPLLLAASLLGACGEAEAPAAQRVLHGNPELGRVLIAERGCTACHAIPGIRALAGSVGPPLAGFGRRAYIAGRLPNRPMMLTAWLRDPPALDPGTAMPAQGLSGPEAQDVAAYLYSLR